MTVIPGFLAANADIAVVKVAPSARQDRLAWDTVIVVVGAKVPVLKVPLSSKPRRPMSSADPAATPKTKMMMTIRFRTMQRWYFSRTDAKATETRLRIFGSPTPLAHVIRYRQTIARI